MGQPPLQGKTSFLARALFVGQRIDVRALEKTQHLASHPLAVRAGSAGCAVLFRFGGVVLFGLEPVEEAAFLDGLKPFIAQPFEDPEREDVEINIDSEKQERVEADESVTLNDASVERLQTVADILAKSAALAHFEGRVAEVFDHVEPLAVNLRQGRTAGGKVLLQQMGDVLLMQQQMVGRVEVIDKPELIWERPDLDRLFMRLEDEYELRERHRALDRKLELISRTAETVLRLLQERRSLRVEWYIVILIMVEIVLTVYGMVTGLH
jgi:uncharacterized Rmd1/YagE family protein